MRLMVITWLLATALAGVAVSAAAAAPARASAVGDAPAGERIALWPPGHIPGQRGVVRPPRHVQRSADPARPDHYVEGIDAPWLAVHAPRHPNGQAVLVIPGGGYQRVVIDKEGTELVPEWVDRAGYTLFVLHYRLPEAGRDRSAALADAQRAMRLIRGQAAARGLDPQTIATMGFSAGGHVAARLATGFDSPAYAAVDDLDRLSARPARVVLVYPVIDMGDHAHPGSRRRLLGPPGERVDERVDEAALAEYSMQRQVRADTPPTLLLHAADDAAVSVDNSLLMAGALAAHGVAYELHVFAHGGHGFGMRAPAGSTTALWPALAQRWLQGGVEARP